MAELMGVTLTSTPPWRDRSPPAPDWVASGQGLWVGVTALPVGELAHNRWVTVLRARPARRLVALVALVAATAVWASTFLVTRQ
jgi:hypothetical protein